MEKQDVNLFRIRLQNEDHCIFEAPTRLTGLKEENAKQTAFNLIMVDVSGSMGEYWNNILTHWNSVIAPALTGSSKLFLFGNDVYFKRNDSMLQDDDFVYEGTNLTEAIKVINEEITTNEEMFIRLFLVTDGDHNSTEITPDVEIAKLSIPEGKTIEVYLLGLGQDFPVEYSISIRSLLHNGNSNVPSLFWAKYSYETGDTDILEPIENMTNMVKMGNVKLRISPSGYLAPGFPDAHATLHLGEFMYFPQPPEDISSELKLSVKDGEDLNLNITIKDISMRFLLDSVFRQWNSIIIQKHRNKENISPLAFEIMEQAKNDFRSKLVEESLKYEKQTIKYRLVCKEIRHIDTEFSTLMNQSKTIIGLEGKYKNELELAEYILKTTVKSKYDSKNLKLKGHGMEDFTNDMNDFVNIYNKIKPSILALPEPSPDDCCRVTMRSFVKDLQDPSLPELLEEDKFTFMKTFTVTGIPIYAPVKDSSQINPWTYCIKNILRSPYSILSHNTLELSAEVGNLDSDSENKEVYLQEGDENSKFNAIVPVFEPDVALVVKPLVTTNVFAMLSTFCILKNPHIIDYSAHIAALGCTWMKLISDHPGEDKPEFVVNQIATIEATAKLYMGRPSIIKYLEVLLTDPKEAIMTESCELYDDKKLKCESLIKPMFFLYLNREKENVSKNLVNIVRLLVLEFIGRCMSITQFDVDTENIYTRLFVPDLDSKDKQIEWTNKKINNISESVIKSFIEESGSSLTGTYFILENLFKKLKAFCRAQFGKLEDSLLDIAVNRKFVNRFRNTGSAGNIRLPGIREFCFAIGLTDGDIESIFQDENIFACLAHSLENKGSKERLGTSIPTYAEAFETVRRKVSSENKRHLKIESIKKIMAEAESIWRSEYLSIHEDVLVQPLTREEIIGEGAQLGVPVTTENFEKLYRHNPKTGLLRNACMTKLCPFYLKPDKTFNQHISIERKQGFVHQLHLASLRSATEGNEAKSVIDHILSDGYTSQNKLKIPQTPSKDSLASMEDKISWLVELYKEKFVTTNAA